MLAMSQAQYQKPVHRSYGVALRTALMHFVFWGIAGPMTFAPILNQLGTEVIESSCYGLSESPIEEDGESSSEPFDVLKSVNRALHLLSGNSMFRTLHFFRWLATFFTHILNEEVSRDLSLQDAVRLSSGEVSNEGQPTIPGSTRNLGMAGVDSDSPAM